jgi:CheY-like chemotaxis protein
LVLLVDDTITIRVVEKLTLGDGYDFVEAVNGREALERLKQQRPDVILLDVMMPELNGIDTLRAIKGDSATKDIPVLMVTTQSETEVLNACTALGCMAFVGKPIVPDELRARVKEAVGG